MINDLDAINGILTVPDGTAAIDDGEFAGREDIIELYLPDSVRSLGIEAFCGCTQLKAVRLPSALPEISPACFAECTALECVELPPSLLNIGEGAFLNCAALCAVQLPEGLREIAPMAFWNTGLEQVTIPEGVAVIGENAFWSCESLRRADVLGKNTLIGENAFGSCYELTSGYIAPGYPQEGDAPSELLYTLLWCSCPDRHGVETSRRAEKYIQSNEALIMERIFKYNNIPALSGIVGRGLLGADKTDGYVRISAENGQAELTALLLKARASGRGVEEELEL